MTFCPREVKKNGNVENSPDI